ncbi:MAG: serine/threonine-protein kinase [Deltaproteobacteria bacterium]|nr:serine/threonine-protein kinase [Deltaproteobacteria bacterium]
MARTAKSLATTNLRVIDQTEESVTAEAEAHYEELVSTSSVDRRLLSGPFATNVWGGRYEIDGFGGEGSQGNTFYGVDIKTGARVALKFFDLGRAKDWKAQDLFDREVQTLKRLHHPGIPQFLDVLTDDDTGARALVMTFIAGDSLGTVLKRDGVIPEKRLWSLLVDTANVMASVHSEGVVHRDLKPDNLILRPDGTVAVVDFGGVGVVRGTAGSTVVGTFGYMAPEQLYGAQTPATDLYALGATVLTLATNKDPEDQPRSGLAIDVDEAAPFLSEPLRELLAIMLSPDPKERPKDAAALLVELKRIATGAPVPGAGKPAARKLKNTNADRTGKVDALWHDGEEVDDAVTAATGGLGILAAIIGTFATIGIGRVLLPFILTIISAFVSEENKKTVQQLQVIVERRAIQLQAEMKKAGLQSAQKLEELSNKDALRRDTKKSEQFKKQMRHLEVESERINRKLKDKSRKGGQFWKRL